jgi:two-component system chemotaxis response regulator CheB
VISGGVRDQSLNITFKALEAGALSVMEKPSHFMAPDAALARRRIIDTVRAMAEIKVIKRRFYTHPQKKHRPEVDVPKRPFELVAIGTSVGGPQALKTLLSALPEHFPVPIVIVQHMTPGFIEGFAKWMDANVRLTVRHVKDNESLTAGTVYFAPDHHHLEVRRGKGKTLIAKLVQGPPVSGFCPSATVLLKSVAETCGKQAIGLLLTGMGSDGSQGLLDLRQAHGHTLIQDKDSAVVFGMGGVAQSLGAVDRVVNLEDMATYLTKILL